MATESYKFHGSKTAGDGTARLVLEGTSTNPKRYVDVGGSVDLSDEEVERLRKSGYRLTKANDPEESEGGSSDPETPAQQQAAQVASGAQHPAADPDKDNTPAARGLRK